ILVKFSPAGVELWAKATDAVLAPIGLAVDSAGNAVIGGTTGFTADIVIQKFSSSGAQIWSRTFNGTGMAADAFSALALDRADNVLITGSTQSAGAVNGASDVVTVKYDSAGTVLWSRVFGRSPETQEQARDIAVDENGGVYIVAATFPDAMVEAG